MCQQATQKQIWQNKRMQKIIAILLLSLTSTAYALPSCPSDQSVRWHNCAGTKAHSDGAIYTGDWKDGKRHGLGTYTFASGNKFIDGEKHSGYWIYNEFVPGVCEGMGLRQGTSEFGQCVLKLMDKL